MPSRRTFLAALGATTLAGCTATPNDPPKSGVEELPDPDGHAYGANGDWSSFGCNAGNTRAVGDGKAPTDGVTERWRVEVPQLRQHEPIAAGGRVYYLSDGLRALDAADGSEAWRAPEIRTLPLVRGETLYAGTTDGVVALDAPTGEPRWKRTLGEDVSVRAPATYAGKRLYVPADETLFALDPETGETDWSRQLFGRLLGSPAVHFGHYVAVASEAGKLFLVGPEGVAAGEWNFPAVPRSPPTADTDAVYVNCRDGRTYGILLENVPRRDVDWATETGWADGGLAVEDHLYANGTDDLRALDTDTGEERWRFDTGDWRHTAPALGRDTLFVGGDALYALDPTPKSVPLADGPAVRFERSFHGRVGPGPTLDDGVLYVVAQTGESAYHLLALE
ncbi:PQQ-binding-like beta-propeller repeat protein [Halorussus limi]|uniref:PQQ-binding-like beta-propeller repeat protein n=1 Tax=Halorussus limi TaxID=2938695 RepID=A0A8U0HV10_9EURY|nr:PQQ-like beta-propeller repeat protein [Halorussus limi]UPV74689.1 PQQ-binding-like beta-propeller repeat protein [Halorussus limi]